MQLRYSLATSSLKLPLRSALKVAARVPGVQAVRIDARTELRPAEMSETGKRELLHFLKEHGLQLSSLSFSTRHAFYEETNLDRRIAATREAMDLAAVLKVPYLSVRVGRIPTEEEPRAWQMLSEVMNDLARHGNHIGVTLAIVPGTEPTERVNQFLEEVRTGPMAIDFDPARQLVEGESISTRLRGLHRYVREFTARDAVRDFSGGSEETSLGRGEVVWDELLATLVEMDYRGWVTLQRGNAENPQQELERAARYLQNILGEF